MKVFSNKRILKKCLIASLIAALMILIFYWASGDRLYFEDWNSAVPEAQELVSNIHDGSVVEFDVSDRCDELNRFYLYIGSAGDPSKGIINVTLSSASGEVIEEFSEPASAFAEYSYHEFRLTEPYKMGKDEGLKVRITSKGIDEEQNISLWLNNSFSTGKYALSDMSGDKFTLDGAEHEGTVCSYIGGRNYYLIGRIFWPAAGIIYAAFVFYIFHLANSFLEGKDSIGLRAYVTYNQYKFLMKQLVGRDFKKKYKRSVLGFGWTILNPLLMMAVQYLVFSTLFKSSIENFVTYLLTGIVLMNFFSESIGLGLTSILDNAHLINKVYMPKGIYPLSRVLSSVVNLCLAMIPLLLVAILSGSPVSKAMLLIPIDLVLLLLFCYGMVLLLSTSMALFKDTFFIWNVLSTLWMYLTPIFYPVEIIPARFLAIYKLNPMYQYITFMRSILIYGQAPTPLNYLGCIISAVVLVAIGYYVFKKNEDKFILYL